MTDVATTRNVQSPLFRRRGVIQCIDISNNIDVINISLWAISITPLQLGAKYKTMQNTWKMTETLANGYSSESTQ